MPASIFDRWDQTSFVLRKHVYYVAFSISVLFFLSYFIAFLFELSIMLLMLLILAVIIDTLIIYVYRESVTAERSMKERLENGLANEVYVSVHNHFPFAVTISIIEELPFQLQTTKEWKQLTLKSGQTIELSYSILPKQRGLYTFGNINIAVNGPLSLIRKRIRLQKEITVKVYPPFSGLKNKQLLGVSDKHQNSGNRKLKQLGQSLEFEQIRNYVPGDDYRTINWKATARNGAVMANNFMEEKSQQVYCIINKGRVMKMPFNGMTLLDYSINAALFLCQTALLRQDRAGLICFGKQVDTLVPAERKASQINKILEALYAQETNFEESDFEKLYALTRTKISQRSLLILFTNFESIESLERELTFLKMLAHYHLLVVVFFQNTELKSLLETTASSTEEIYTKTIAEKYQYDKYLMVRELRKNGIIGILSTPQQLSVNVVNKYIELKKSQLV